MKTVLGFLFCVFAALGIAMVQVNTRHADSAQYLHDLRVNGTITTGSDAALLDLGHTACTQIRQGVPEETIVATLVAMSPGLQDADGQFLCMSAEMFLC